MIIFPPKMVSVIESIDYHSKAGFTAFLFDILNN